LALSCVVWNRFNWSLSQITPFRWLWTVEEITALFNSLPLPSGYGAPSIPFPLPPASVGISYKPEPIFRFSIGEPSLTINHWSSQLLHAFIHHFLEGLPSITPTFSELTALTPYPWCLVPCHFRLLVHSSRMWLRLSVDARQSKELFENRNLRPCPSKTHYQWQCVFPWISVHKFDKSTFYRSLLTTIMQRLYWTMLTILFDGNHTLLTIYISILSRNVISVRPS
jgi:hypothetical protein